MGDTDGMRPLRLVVFDCDGVLVDSWAATMYFYNEVCSMMERGPMTPEEEAYVFVSTIPQGIARLVGSGNVDQALAMSGDIPVEDVVSRIVPMRGVADALAALKVAGCTLAVCTNGGAEQHHVLAGHGLAGFFDHVVTSDDVARPKPHPDGLELLMRKTGHGPEATVFVGDSDSDRITAAAAGVQFWGFGTADLDADLHVPDFGWLKAHLPEVLAGTKP